MELFAKRVRANRPPEKSTSISSEDESFLMRSKMSPACSVVSIQPYLSVLRSRTRTSLIPFECATHLDPAKARWRRPMTRSHYLLWLPFAAIRCTPQRPLISRADRIQCIPELCGDTRIRRVLHHPHTLAVLDLPTDLASKLKVVALV